MSVTTDGNVSQF